MTITLPSPLSHETATAPPAALTGTATLAGPVHTVRAAYPGWYQADAQHLRIRTHVEAAPIAASVAGS